MIYFQSSRSDEFTRDSSAPILSGNIKEANSVEELMKIFDKYVVPTEFALGLQKMCQLASMENSNASQIYAQLSNARNRMETLLISFVSHLFETKGKINFWIL